SRIKITDASFNIQVPGGGGWPQIGIGGRRSKGRLSFDTIESWPVSSVELQNVAVNADIQSLPAIVHIDSVNMTLDSQFRSIRADLAVRNLRFQKKGETSVYHGDVAANFLLDEEGV